MSLQPTDPDRASAPSNGEGASGRRPRLADVAARVGLSPASVSLVLRGEPGPSPATREMVLAAARDLGYRADRTASLLARRRSRLLGLLLDVSSAFHAEFVDHIYVAAEQQGYDVVLSTLTRSRDESRAVETLLDFRCEALILLGPDAPAARLAALARTQPVVVVGRRLRAGLVDVVRSADDLGVGLAVDHLVGLGHRQIVYVDAGAGTIAADRRRGYRAALARHGLLGAARILAGGRAESGGIRAAKTLLSAGPLPTAVVTFNDRCAVGLLDTLIRGGLSVPGDVSVTGYDDSILARMAHVDLTSVNQDAEQQAKRAVAAAVARLESSAPVRVNRVLLPRLVLRGSTDRPRAV